MPGNRIPGRKNHGTQEPEVETFLKRRSRRKPKPARGDSEGSDIQEIGVISDRKFAYNILRGSNDRSNG